MSLKERIKTELLFFEGGMGTQLQAAGLPAGELPERWNLTHPQAVQAVHEAYLAAGCQLVKANTFGASRPKLEAEGLDIGEVIPAALRIARAAREQIGADAYVGLDIGPCGRLLQPFGDLPFEEAVSLFAEMVEAGKDLADFVLIETMSDLYEAKAAILAAKEHCDLPIIVTLSFDGSGKLLTGADPATAALALQDLGIDALGFNCGLGPKQMLSLLPSLQAVCSLPIAVCPNAGLPQTVDGKTVYNVSPAEFAADAEALIAQGAAILGGCCGSTPAHLAETVKRCKDLPRLPISQNIPTAVTSYSRSAVFGERPLLIGERLNPTGKARLKQALREGDTPYLLHMAVEQVDAGADILDVNVGLPELDEPQVMTDTVAALQAVTALPLQIDTTNVEAMEKALRVYNGKPLLNSVNGKAETLETVLPLVKKYGAAVVGLTLDESGIPDSVAGRMAIAEKIAAACDRYGIPRRNLIIDPLCLSVSTGAQNANITLDTVEAVRQRLGLHTVLGVSNVSFGLPQRETVNASFFTQAMRKGLSAGIINPLSAALTDAYVTYLALAGQDEACAAYIARMADRAETVVTATVKQAVVSESGSPLHKAIVKGFAEDSRRLAAEALQTTEPLTLINETLIPALDEVGKGFESGKVFLPQLLTAASAASAAFDAVREVMQQSGTQQNKGTVVIATVQGDIHDIGKNIVKTLLENYGYEVIDLGRDVSPETVAQTVTEKDVRLCGLSALMTTTVPSMERTVRLLHEVAPACKVMVGGAVLTERYAEMIGADAYAPDALGAVRYAEEVFG